MEKQITIKAWGTRLRGKEAANRLRDFCVSSLPTDETLYLNMVGVKSVSNGFAYECFGKLYLEAKKRNSAIKFLYAKKKIAPTLLNGVKAAVAGKYYE